LEKSGDKYFSMDVINMKCQIYNLDHSIYKTINLTVPPDYYLYNILHVSEHTFNQDDLVEIVYIYSKYNLTETSYYYSYETKVINENGLDILPAIHGAGHTEILETVEEGRKFLVYVYDFFQIPATTQTLVYSLPKPVVEPLKSGPIRQQNRLGNPWPNPTGGMINIPIKLPPDAEPGELILYNIHGQEVMRHPVNGDEELIVMPGGTLIPGTYVYKLKSGNAKSQGKKITIR
ncbi:T9SS type A sorting domain-containing protein, partial [Bacteroidota bacterium]